MSNNAKLSIKVKNKLKAIAKARLPGTASAKQSRSRKAAKTKPAQGNVTPTAAVPKQRGRFSALSITELKEKYREVVGRDTGSDDRGYLTWKIREAENGRVPVGPRKVRAAGEMTTLPFRIPTAASDAMDEAWRARGVKSRNRFLQDAVGHYLTYLGEPSAAEQFSTNQAPVAS